MTTLRRIVLLTLCVSGASFLFTQTTSAQIELRDTSITAFLHATVIPMDSERVLRDQTVVVVNGRIAAIGATSGVKVPDAALRVDATGRYLMPALCDMHVHLLGEAWNMMLPPDLRMAAKSIPQERFLFPYIANGVTTVQALSATPEEVALRGKIERGEMIGPRLILARMIDGPKKAWPPPISTWVDSPTEARDAVRQAKADGYDKIKVYSFLSKESYDAIVTTAKELGMDVIGHIPMSLSPEYVLDSKQKLIAHSEELMKHAGADYSAKHIDYYASKMVESDTWMIPTLVTTQSFLDFFVDPQSIYAKPEGAYFQHPMQQGAWSFMARNLYAPIPPAMRAKLRDGFERFQRPLTKAFHDKGGKIVAGSDALMIGLYPGTGLHGELRELVAVGLTPYEALRTSTTAPFEYLGEADRAGTVAVGKQSDLLLVDANPLEDITAVSKVAGVLVRGRWIDRDAIGETMQRIAISKPGR